MRIAFLETHNLAHKRYRKKQFTSAVGWYRMKNPAQQLKKATDWEIKIIKGNFKQRANVGTNKKLYRNWEDLISNFEIIYTLNTSNYPLYLYISQLASKYGVKMVMDFDDNLFEIPEYFINFKKIHLGTGIFHSLLETAKLSHNITCTNEFLRKRLRYFGINSEIEILPNFIDLEIYSFPKIKITKKQFVNIIFFGPSSHSEDLDISHFQIALIKLIEKHPQVIFTTIGFQSKSLKRLLGINYQYFEKFLVFEKWIDMWKKKVCSADIAVAPLKINNFTKAKSPIKYFESAAASLPFVCSDIRPYRQVIENGKNGFLCRTAKDWYQTLDLLVQNESIRTTVGKNGLQNIIRNYTIQKNINIYKDYFNKLYKTYS